MRPIVPTSPFICARCIRAGRAAQPPSFSLSLRWASKPAESPQRPSSQDNTTETHNGSNSESKEQRRGAMAARLEQMSEEALENNPSGAAKVMSDAGFSEQLRKQLEERIAGANFRNENAGAISLAGMPESAPKHARDIAGATPWEGTESVEDASLRMLNDAYKPMRGPRAPPGGMRLPTRVDTGRARKNISKGARIASARENSATYERIKGSPLSPEEREKMLQEMRARFEPNARSVVPGTIQGLASLANKRIEDAIARGQFKNLPRGKVIERDYTASSPFLDTTEYFMNKIIQKQDIVPPWIEKQQELVSTANKFRQRLRNDWKRHAARVIASKGGLLQDQMEQARCYAEAELRENLKLVKEERLNSIDSDGQISQISLSGELRLPPAESTSPATPLEAHEEVLVTTSTVSPTSNPADIPSPSSTSDPLTPSASPSPPTSPPPLHPFRDPAWLATELSYLRVAIENLNTIARSYNLQAPRVAQRPYYNLERELRACYADVAPQLADAIREKALAPKARNVVLHGGREDAGVLDRLVGTGTVVRVRDERGEKRYGFKQFWKDLWRKEGVE